MQIEKLLKVAAAEIGTKESPPNSNNVLFNTWFYNKPVSGSNYAWCCTFVCWCFEQAGLSALWLNGNTKETAYCPYVVGQAQKLKQWVRGFYKPGDVILFDFNGQGNAQHIGICESVKSDGTLVCIEGNTSSTSNDNGGAVMRCNRKVSQVLGAFRPKYIEDKGDNQENKQTEEEIEVRYQRLSDIPENSNFRNIINLLMDAKILNGDGSDPTGNNDVIDLSHDMVRMIVLTYRGGAYDAAIKAAGLNPGAYK